MYLLQLPIDFIGNRNININIRYDDKPAGEFLFE